MAPGIEVFVADEQNAFQVDIPKWRDLAEKVIDHERRQRGIGGMIEASVLFVDEMTIQDLNERFRNVNAPTDVLSFAIDEDLDDEPVVRDGRTPDGGSLSPTGPKAADDTSSDMPTLLGDVVVCPSIAARNAPDHAGNYDDELALLVVHGILHLFGMDHQDDTEAEVMEAREQALLAAHYGPVAASAWPDSHGGLVGVFEDDEEDDEDDEDDDAIDLTELEDDEEDDDEDDDEQEDDDA
jgi:probable rRNA maturation factor